ncbi:2-oxo acid dehydrogenase subunit E2 [Enterovibrio makurazakiensis]|uniref:2-oxo acid dehydrogenase subunit E2 n=1 Tax=Enterovibrio gelatinilyticus TaxID=2899819 RepID=A0ABT5QW66_9GAMM|nr:2-oxo acid dehydrogenase subunit E2 [Enterovibrio sp. ZSDZ42]MDD1792234.1 2-oxo acid dehydrogenase subunit E2 [Enterovibrio sp. ZSDZ42]
MSDNVIALKGMRGMIADNMRRSLDEAAQLTHHASCDVTDLLAYKALLSDEGINVSVEDLLCDCVVGVLKKHPEMNGRVEGQEIVLSSAIHLSVAIALPGNLLVAPTIFDAQTLSLQEKREARKALITKARKGKLSIAEMTKGTFTVSNLGLSRVQYFTPIINIPQIAILGIGQTVKRNEINEQGDVETRSILGLSLTFDHRAVDGGPAAEFLTSLCEHIEQGSGCLSHQTYH